jgi:putative transposase
MLNERPTWGEVMYQHRCLSLSASRCRSPGDRSSVHFALDALEQALYARRSEREGALVHHSDRGSLYVSIRYSERLAEAGIEPSVGSTGDSYANALAETINGLYKAEIIRSSTGAAPGRREMPLRLCPLQR